MAASVLAAMCGGDFRKRDRRVLLDLEKIKKRYTLRCREFEIFGRWNQPSTTRAANYFSDARQTRVINIGETSDA